MSSQLQHKFAEICEAKSPVSVSHKTFGSKDTITADIDERTRQNTGDHAVSLTF